MVQRIPQRFPEIGVKAYESAGFLGQSDCFHRGFSYALMSHGKGSKVEKPGVLYEFFLQLVCAEHHIRTGIPIEGEITVTVFKGMYQCQCGVDLIIQHQIFRADSQILKRFLQRHTELVFADFADKGSFFAEVVQHGEDVARSAAGICFEQSVALFAETILGKVDQ